LSHNTAAILIAETFTNVQIKSLDSK